MSPIDREVPWLLTPSVLLPVQVPSPWAERWLRRLCRAILADALACLDGKGTPGTMGSDRDGARRAGQAQEWFRSEATYLFSFATVCAVLDLEVEAVRRQVCRRVPQDKPDRHIGVRAQEEATTAAARQTVARAHTAHDRTRKLLQEGEEARQLHRAIAERKAEHHPRPHSEELSRPTPQASEALPEAIPGEEEKEWTPQIVG